MEILEIAFLLVGVVQAALILAMLHSKWHIIRHELEREAGWHRMWTERIYWDESEDDGRAT